MVGAGDAPLPADGLASEAPAEFHRLDLIAREPERAEQQACPDGKVIGDAAAGPGVARMSNDAFYDDWLHRGTSAALRDMCHYIYAMLVRVVPRITAASQGDHFFDFDPHYVKAGSHVQVLLDAPRTPYPDAQRL